MEQSQYKTNSTNNNMITIATLNFVVLFDKRTRTVIAKSYYPPTFSKVIKNKGVIENNNNGVGIMIRELVQSRKCDYFESKNVYIDGIETNFFSNDVLFCKFDATKKHVFVVFAEYLDKTRYNKDTTHMLIYSINNGILKLIKITYKISFENIVKYIGLNSANGNSLELEYNSPY